MKFLVTFEKVDAALFARAAEALYVDGLDVGDVFDDADSSGWIDAGDAGAVVHAPARLREPELIAGRIARTVALYGVGAQVVHLP